MAWKSFPIRNQIKRQAYLVLKENEILQKQVELETNQLAEIQRNQIDEGFSFRFTEIGSSWKFSLVSNLNRRLLLIETEKAENDRILETFRIRNEDLRRKYEQILRENDHRISIAEHINEVNEMKHLTGSRRNLLRRQWENSLLSYFLDELSEKHGREMFQLLRRIQVCFQRSIIGFLQSRISSIDVFLELELLRWLKLMSYQNNELSRWKLAECRAIEVNLSVLVKSFAADCKKLNRTINKNDAIP